MQNKKTIIELGQKVVKKHSKKRGWPIRTQQQPRVKKFLPPNQLGLQLK